MPTPSDETDDIAIELTPTDISASSLSHTTCPPEDRTQQSRREEQAEHVIPSTESTQTSVIIESVAQMPTPEEPDAASSVVSETTPKPMEIVDDDALVREARLPTPSSPMIEDSKENESRVAHSSLAIPTALPTYSDYPLSKKRLIPNSTSSFLRPGSKFHGTQQSDRQTYDVQVEIKHVDMEESFLCGYLRIQGLTDDHPTLTTYFEGEIIGTKHSFKTAHPEWGSTEKVDMQHWARFPPWKPLAKSAKNPNFTCKNFAQREHLFMRWKEYFLVPDHKVKSITGASFEGFYYICFNQCSGVVSGIYFHSRSEKYQQLELVHVSDRGCMGAVEFR